MKTIEYNLVKQAAYIAARVNTSDNNSIESFINDYVEEKKIRPNQRSKIKSLVECIVEGNRGPDFPSQN